MRDNWHKKKQGKGQKNYNILQAERPRPPVMAEVRRPHLSDSKKAGIEIANIKMPDMPDARNDAVAEDKPA